MCAIIPLREMEGNYNHCAYALFTHTIIPLREMEGNYNCKAHHYKADHIIPLREMEGNYNPSCNRKKSCTDYTLERDGRELQLRR